MIAFVSLLASALVFPMPMAAAPAKGGATDAATPAATPAALPPDVLEIVPAPRVPTSIPPVPSSTPLRLPEPPAMIGMMMFAPAAPTAFHVRGPGGSRSGGGAAFLSFSGRGWYLPTPTRVGETWRFGGAISPGELSVDKRVNGFFWPLEAQIARGVRAPLGRDTFFHALVGLEGLLRMSGRTDDGAQRRRGYLHFPELSLALSHGGRRSYVEIGPIAGLAIVGIDDVAFSRERSAGAPTYALRPYAGARAAFVDRRWLASVSAHHTWLGAPAERDERLVGLLCRHVITPRHRAAFGGCLQGDVARARGAGAAEATSYEITLRLGLLYLST